MADRMSEPTRQYAASVKARGLVPEPKPLDLDAISDRIKAGDIDRIDVRALVDEIRWLRARVAMLEDCVLAGAELLWSDEEWGPRPDRGETSYVAYLHEGYHETAAEIRGRREEARRA